MTAPAARASARRRSARAGPCCVWWPERPSVTLTSLTSQPRRRHLDAHAAGLEVGVVGVGAEDEDAGKLHGSLRLGCGQSGTSNKTATRRCETAGTASGAATPSSVMSLPSSFIVFAPSINGEAAKAAAPESPMPLMRRLRLWSPAKPGQRAKPGGPCRPGCSRADRVYEGSLNGVNWSAPWPQRPASRSRRDLASSGVPDAATSPAPSPRRLRFRFQ